MKVRTLIVFFLCCLSVVAPVLALTPDLTLGKNLYGLTFPIQEYQEVDADLVKITIEGKTTLLSKDKSDEFIVTSFFKNEKFQPTTEQLLRFIQLSIDDSRNIFEPALVRILSTVNSEEQITATLKKLFDSFASETVEAKLAFQTLKLSELVSKSIRLSVITEIFPYLPSGSGNLVLSKIVGDEQDFIQRLIKKFDKLLEIGKSSLAQRLLAELQSMFPLEQRVLAPLVLTLNRIAQLQKILNDKPSATDYEQYADLVDACLSDASRRSVYKNILTEFIHAAASAALKENNRVDAIKYLTRLSLDWRTPQTHNLAKAVFSEMSDVVALELTSMRAQIFFENIAKNDSIFQATYIESIQALFLKSLLQKQTRSAESYFSALLRVRSDPHPENDLLREKFAMVYNELGLNEKAERIISESSSPVSFGTKFRLFLSSLVTRKLTWVLLILALTLAGILTYVTRRSKENSRGFTKPKSRSKSETESHAEMFEQAKSSFKSGGFTQERFEPPPFKARSGSYARKSQREEYYYALNQLGLDKEADLQQIKVAYRNLVKRVHPDKRAQSEEAREKFLELQNLYQKTLSIRKELGLD